VLWYAALACDALGLSMGEVMAENIDKLRRRYPDGFSSERSLRRSE
jgi:NTP pyrophosphatase (non-canonical NTP hydrolase)